MTLENMGYTDFGSNLIRARKYTEDHINNVITDYLANPDNAESQPESNPVGSNDQPQPSAQLTED